MTWWLCHPGILHNHKVLLAAVARLVSGLGPQGTGQIILAPVGRMTPAQPSPFPGSRAERLGRAIFSWQLQAPGGRLLGLLCLVHQLKGSPVELLTWFKSHQSCLPAEVWETGGCNAGVPPVGPIASAGGNFNWAK